MNELSPEVATAVFRAGLAGGATSGSVTLGRKVCRATLEELRVQALSNALQRAQTIAKHSGGRLGALYRVKESLAQCWELTSRPITAQIHLDETGDVAGPRLMLPELGAVAARTVLHPRVEVLLVYELASDREAPSGEAPGEVHLGLNRTFDAATKDVLGTVSLRARVLDADPSTALQKAVSIMDGVTRALRSDGLTDAELVSSEAQIDTRQQVVKKSEALVRVPQDYIAESRITITTGRFAELGRWLRTAALSGATGLDGPFYEIADPEGALDRALASAAKQASTDADVLARAAGQSLRAPTHVRAACGWLSETDPLRTFVEELGAYGMSGLGLGGGFGQSGLQPDSGFPEITILPPTLYAKGELAIGFALTPADR